MTHRCFAGSILALLLSTIALDACATVARFGESIKTTKETAIIIWDATNKKQHFVRMATFETNNPSFGFIVPTPTKPELVEVSTEPFSLLQREVTPKLIDKRWNFVIEGCSERKQHILVEQVNVGGYEASILKASDGENLNRWLKENDYQSEPAFVDWLDVYAKKGFYITAFKIAQDPIEKQKAYTAAIRMSCDTDQPFYPYREPISTISNPQRSLRVFFLAPGRYQAHVNGKPWDVQNPHASLLSEYHSSVIARNIKLDQADQPYFLTEFEDRASTRAGDDDVIFSPAENNQEFRRPDTIIKQKYANLMITLMVIGGLAVIRFGFWAKKKLLVRE